MSANQVSVLAGSNSRWLPMGAPEGNGDPLIWAAYRCLYFLYFNIWQLNLISTIVAISGKVYGVSDDDLDDNMKCRNV